MSFELFDEKAHELLSDLFDAAEDCLTRQGICGASEADEYLTLEYIKTCGEYIEHAATFLQSEGATASLLFISKLAELSDGGRSAKYVQRCADQLSLHAGLYFPKFRKLLTASYLTVLHSIEDMGELQRSGILMLAAATLPGVRTELRREFRRRGLQYDRTLVPDNVLRLRLECQPQYRHFICRIDP